MILDEQVEALLEKYIKDNSIVSFGTGPTNDLFLKKLALHAEQSGIRIKVVPTALSMAEMCTKFRIPTVSLDDVEVDLAFDFVDQVDEDFNYISNETTSLIRDKMIAQSAAELVVVCEENDFVSRLTKNILIEISPFAHKKTIVQLMNLGESKLKLLNGKPMLSETGNYFAELAFDSVYSLDDVEYEARKIPGMLETSLFLGYADRVILHGATLTVKSRLTNTEMAEA